MRKASHWFHRLCHLTGAALWLALLVLFLLGRIVYGGWLLSHTILETPKKIARGIVLVSKHSSSFQFNSSIDYVLEPNEKGKMVPRKVGLAPIQRDGLEYEFDVVGDMNLENELIVGKSRCSALSGQIIAQPGLQLADMLKKWLLDGTSVSVPQGAVATNGNPHNERVKQIRTLLGIEGKAVLEWLKTEMLMNSPAELETGQVDELIQWMALQWAVKQGMQHNHALPSFNKHVGAMVQQGYEELDAIQAWMQHVAEQKQQAVEAG